MTITNPSELRKRYLAEAIQTATPAMRLVMLFDALDLDLRRADAAFDGQDLKAISDNLIHAQEILLTLRDTLRTDLWDAGESLRALYDLFHTELLGANLDKDRARAARVAVLVARLAEAWRSAAASTIEGEAGAAKASATPDTAAVGTARA